MQKSKLSGKSLYFILALLLLLVAAVVTSFSLMAKSEPEKEMITTLRVAYTKALAYKFSDYDYTDLPLEFRHSDGTLISDKINYYYTERESGEYAAVYCFEPSNDHIGVNAEYDYDTSADGKLSPEKAALLAFVLAYGVRGWDVENVYQEEHQPYVLEDVENQIATQLAVWMVATGVYLESAYDNLLPRDGAGVAPTPEICLETRRLITEAKNAMARDLPDFENGTYQMAQADGKYKVIITDTSGTLAQWQTALEAAVAAYNADPAHAGDNLEIEIDADGGTITFTADKLTEGSIELLVTSDEMLTKATLIYMSGYGGDSKSDGVTRFQDMLSVETAESELRLTLKLTLTRAYDAALQKWVSEVIRGGETVPDIGEDEVEDGVPSEVWRVRRGDVVKYTIRVINQCDENLKIREIVDYLPEGLLFDATYPGNEGWAVDGALLRYSLTEENAVTLAPGESETVALYLTVNPLTPGVITNYAEISQMTDENDETVDDVDSTPDDTNDDGAVQDNEIDNKNDDEDDHDYAKIEVPLVDAALQKWVFQVIRDGKIVSDFGEDEIEDGVPSEVWKVRLGDMIVYRIRVLNQGDYPLIITEITDYLPVWLEFDGGLPANAGWSLAPGGPWTLDDGTAYNKIKYTANPEDPILLEPGEDAIVEITVKAASAPSAADKTIRNGAEISGMTDENGGYVEDVDSTPDDISDNDPPPQDNEVGNKDGDEDDEDFAEIEILPPPSPPSGGTTPTPSSPPPSDPPTPESPPSGSPPPDLEIEEASPPGGEWNGEEIIDDEVPAGGLVPTGDASQNAWFGLAVGAAAAALLLLTKRRKSK